MQTLAARVGWVLAGLLGVTLAASWAGVITAGPLDPPGNPGSTMKTLEEIPGSWSRMLSSAGGCDSERFDCVLSNGAVLDRETGLVWDQAPDTDTMDWASAVLECEAVNNGGRLGFRLPTISELATLSDVLEPVTGLPPGHPFTIGIEDYFWSSTEDRVSPLGRAMKFDFTSFGTSDELKTQAFRVWCVRGPGGGDVQ